MKKRLFLFTAVLVIMAFMVSGPLLAGKTCTVKDKSGCPSTCALKAEAKPAEKAAVCDTTKCPAECKATCDKSKCPAECKATCTAEQKAKCCAQAKTADKKACCAKPTPGCCTAKKADKP